MNKSLLSFYLAGLMVAFSLGDAQRGQAADAIRLQPIKVMSFNIRYGSAADGVNHWDHRKEFVRETIQLFNPDLLGLQEALDFQLEYLREQLAVYGVHGAGREDGQQQGEFVPVFYRLSRFELIEAGHFWLSETPDLPGSKSWDSSLPRMVSWVVLHDRTCGRELVFANTHFDHRGPRARLESARLIRERALEAEGEYPIILTGDFNTTEDEEPYACLVGGNTGSGRAWIDAYRAVHPERSPRENSFGNWRGVRTGSRIDWILHTDEFNTLNAMLDYTRDGDRYPSDHYPTTAILRLR